MKGKINDRGLLAFARADLKVAVDSLKEHDEVYTNIALFHISQSAEKLMKFLCSCYDIEYDYSHFLASLADKLTDVGVEIPQLVQDSLGDYAKWATRARYITNKLAQRSFAEKQIECIRTWIDKVEQQFGFIPRMNKF